ncbi:MAG: hypothetical protein MJA83_16915, partial [Gammaproteobacteria bacterium]|nr:hypothetical protein [Gammaproteobacteria bacterium]
GDLGGGEVLIGGDYQGKNPNVQNSNVTYVGGDVSINADAITNGDGGKVIIWADDTTRSYADISTQGGTVSGDGGFVEVSGKKYLEFDGFINTSAANGQTGTLLLDPTDIVISDGTGDGAADGNTTFAGNPSGTTGTVLQADTGPTTIFESELQGIVATTNIELQASNNITINNLTDNTLALQQTSGNTVTFTADSDSDGAGGFSMDASDTISTAGGDLTISGDTVTLGDISIGGGTFNVTADAVQLNDVTAGALNVDTSGGGGDITDSANATINITNLADLNAGLGNITIGDSGTDSFDAGTLNVAGATVTVTEDSATTLTGITADTATINSGGAITDAAGTTINVTNVATFDANAGASAITLGDNVADTFTVGSLDLTGSTVTITEDDSSQLDNVSATNLSLTAAGVIGDGVAGTVDVTGTTTLNASAANDIILDSANNDFGTVSFT